MRQCACALECGALARAKYARRSTISRGTAAGGLWGSDCPRPALLNHQPTSLLSSPNTCRPPSLQLPTSTRSPPWTPKNLVMPCPSGHHLCIQLYRIPQRSSTATSDILIHHLLKMQTQTCSYDFIYCLYHGEVEESVLYFLTSWEHQAQLRWSIGPEDLYTQWKQRTANAEQEMWLALLQLKSTQEMHY